MVKIEVLVIGCAKCKRLERNTEQAIKELGIETEILRIEDIDEIRKRGILRSPALFIDGELRVVGRVPSVDEIKSMITGDEMIDKSST